MNHLIVCREYPPAPYLTGGIGTYVCHIAHLLAQAGEVVHVIGQLWEGAPRQVEEFHGGRLIVHRVPLIEPVPDRWSFADVELQKRALLGLTDSDFPAQSFSWQASLLAESLVESEQIDAMEAQEWEAPLYYFLLRRALGMGPKRHPPCIVHLHSPTEFIFRHNEWDLSLADYLPAKRLEDYVIAAADALLCPSHYLARQAESHYGLDPGSIHIIPYPMGETPRLERTRETWEKGSFCYVGRLELRKGILEWIGAALEVSSDYPNTCFEFIGGDTPYTGSGKTSVGQIVKAQIPKALTTRFRFRGAQPRAVVLQYLAKACVAVVPSRWENFPNSCIEAMCTGLPVIASPDGGMTELLVDGHSGWIAPNSRSDGLVAALRRALDTPAQVRAQMGAEGAKAVRRICDNRAIVQRHVELRAQLASRGSQRSMHLPSTIHVIARSSEAAPKRSSNASTTPEDGGTGDGVAIVVTCLSRSDMLDECLARIRLQTVSPAGVVVVVVERDEVSRLAVARARNAGWRVITQRSTSAAAAKNNGIHALFESTPAPLGISFITEDLHLHPGFLAACESVLRYNSCVGVVSSWVRHKGADDRIRIRPCPAMPYQWLVNDVEFHSVIRTEALRGAGLFRLDLAPGFDTWDLFNAVMVAGWAAVTYPAILATRLVEQNPGESLGAGTSQSHMYQVLLSRFPRELARDATRLMELLQPVIAQCGTRDLRYSSAALALGRFNASRLSWLLKKPLVEKLELLRAGLRSPGLAARWLVWQCRGRVKLVPALRSRMPSYGVDNSQSVPLPPP